MNKEHIQAEMPYACQVEYKHEAQLFSSSFFTKVMENRIDEWNHLYTKLDTAIFIKDGYNLNTNS